jgi:hypothetical protein
MSICPPIFVVVCDRMIKTPSTVLTVFNVLDLSESLSWKFRVKQDHS